MENFSERSEILKLLESVVTAQRKFMGGVSPSMVIACSKFQIELREYLKDDQKWSCTCARL